MYCVKFNKQNPSGPTWRNIIARWVLKVGDLFRWYFSIGVHRVLGPYGTLQNSVVTICNFSQFAVALINRFNDLHLVSRDHSVQALLGPVSSIR